MRHTWRCRREATTDGTAQAWRERVTAQQASGKSIRAWCRENTYHGHAFYWWRARLGLPRKSVTKRPKGRQPAKSMAFAKSSLNVLQASRCVCVWQTGVNCFCASMAVQQVARLVQSIDPAS